jgi:phosphate transport system ATP-binding protein
VDTSEGGRTGYLVEYGDNRQIFDEPKAKETRDYISGEFS